MKRVLVSAWWLAVSSIPLATTGAVSQQRPLDYDRAVLAGERPGDRPILPPAQPSRGDTTWFGQYEQIGGDYYALPFGNKSEGSWTFDRGIGPFPPLTGDLIQDAEGWRAEDLSTDTESYFQAIDGALDLGDAIPPPIVSGSGSLWIGADRAKADSLCWPCGAGYGNDWCQRVVSPPLVYDGVGEVVIGFLYWSHAEPCKDGTQLYLRRGDGTELLLNPYPSGSCPEDPDYTGGTFTDSIGHYADPAFYERILSPAEIAGAQSIRFILEYRSDDSGSDEDCEYETTWGPFGADEIVIVGGGIDADYDFEAGLEGWTASPCEPVGSYAGIADLAGYLSLDPCLCRLEENVLELHAGAYDSGDHPDGQFTLLSSPICDFGSSTPRAIAMEMDLYVDLPLENGVLIRPGWRYYPHTCAATGAVGWSERVGLDTYQFFALNPNCFTWRCGGTEVANGTPVPPDAEQVIALLELRSDCEAFSIQNCSGVTNYTPLIDNITVFATGANRGPPISFDIGSEFQDVGSWPSDLFDPRASGPVNVANDRFHSWPERPNYCGDSLAVTGPQVDDDPATHWEARLWWRIAKRGPFQADFADGAETRYKIWKDRVADGRLIDRPDSPQFAYAWMDSVEVGGQGLPNKFFTEFREDDDDFAGEGTEENEILMDDIFVPGTRVEYFVTSNYVVTPNAFYYLPDTSGGYFSEFEILPGLRTAHVPNCGGLGFDTCVYQPATLYLDVYDAGEQVYVENALRSVLNGLDLCQEPEGCLIPGDRNWDRYDYLGSCACWNAPFARGTVAGSNNGMTLSQVLGYRAILVGAGDYDDAMHEEDIDLFDAWLSSSECQSNLDRQVLVANGDRIGEIFMALSNGEPFLQNVFGATLTCNAFNGRSGDPDCGEENDSYCVRWLPADGGPFGTEIDIDGYGSGCPNLLWFNVLNENGGIGNRTYVAEDGGKEMSFAQVVNEDLGSGANYRTILDGVSWHHRTVRTGMGGDASDAWCPRDLPSIVEAAADEIGAALRWGFGVTENAAIPKLSGVEDLAACEGTWDLPAGLDTGPTRNVNRLFPSRPNPSGTTATIDFSLARRGPVVLEIYDVLGRRVRTLVDEARDAGRHRVVWDGKNDSGTRVASGLYWSRMRTGSFTSNRKVVVLR